MTSLIHILGQFCARIQSSLPASHMMKASANCWKEIERSSDGKQRRCSEVFVCYIRYIMELWRMKNRIKSFVWKRWSVWTSPQSLHSAARKRLYLVSAQLHVGSVGPGLKSGVGNLQWSGLVTDCLLQVTDVSFNFGDLFFCLKNKIVLLLCVAK